MTCYGHGMTQRHIPLNKKKVKTLSSLPSPSPPPWNPSSMFEEKNVDVPLLRPSKKSTRSASPRSEGDESSTRTNEIRRAALQKNLLTYYSELLKCTQGGFLVAIARVLRWANLSNFEVCIRHVTVGYHTADTAWNTAIATRHHQNLSLASPMKVGESEDCAVKALYRSVLSGVSVLFLFFSLRLGVSIPRDRAWTCA